MNMNADRVWWVAFFMQIGVSMLVGALLYLAITSLPFWHQPVELESSPALRTTHTPVGKMMTVEHETHSYIIMIHGQNGVALLHSPDCGCKATQSMSYPFNW